MSKKKPERPEYPGIPSNRGEPPDHARTPSPYVFAATNGEVYLTPEGSAKLAEYRKALELYKQSVTGTAAKKFFNYRQGEVFDMEGQRCRQCAHYARGEVDPETFRRTKKDKCVRLKIVVTSSGMCTAFERKPEKDEDA